jgi:L,D-transpeptidase YcbB
MNYLWGYSREGSPLFLQPVPVNFLLNYSFSLNYFNTLYRKNYKQHYSRWFILVISLILLQCMTSGRGKGIKPDIGITPEPYLLPIYFPYDIPDIRNYKDLFNTTEFWTHSVESFYQQRNFKFAWIRNGKIRQEAYDLIHSIALAEWNGLSSSKYNIVQIYSSIKKINSSASYFLKFPGQFVNLDVSLTHAYLQYAQDLLSGSLNPDKFEILLETHPRSRDLVSYLSNALENKTIQQSLEELNPGYDQYGKLKNNLAELLELRENKGYPSLSYVPYLTENDTNINVLKVKEFLHTTGDLGNGNEDYYDSPVFDAELTLGVKLFQYRHGLKPDGELNEETLERMNILLDDRIDKVRINMERLRWLPADLGKRYILVNLPAYSVEYYENDTLKLKMKAIIGKIENYTPALKDTLKYIVFNPQWNIPRSIASDKMLKNLKADSGYYDNSSYSFFRTSYTSMDTVKTDSIDWENISPDKFPFYAVQGPGPANALGKVKFMFPNNEAIYLHDTPNDSLFRMRERDFSHGCVRLEKPFELAELILKDQGNSSGEIRDILQKNEPDTLFVENPVMVHFVYHSVWVDDADNIHFRDDIYGLDKQSIMLMDDYPKRRFTN